MSEDRYKHYHTHDLTKNHEINYCRECGHHLMSLGMWGDDEWKRHHQLWRFTCQQLVRYGYFGEDSRFSIPRAKRTIEFHLRGRFYELRALTPPH